MIYLDEKDMKILKDILRHYPYDFYAHGSRVKGTHQKYSDLDICIIGDISDEQLVQLRGELEESNLTVIVDLIKYNDINEEFKNSIQNDLQKI